MGTIVWGVIYDYVSRIILAPLSGEEYQNEVAQAQARPKIATRRYYWPATLVFDANAEFTLPKAKVFKPTVAKAAIAMMVAVTALART